MRKYNVKEIDLRIDKVEPFNNEEYSGFSVYWDSKIGFGEYTIYKENGKEEDEWHGNSETMDCNENKEFITELMRLFVEQLIIH